LRSGSFRHSFARVGAWLSSNFGYRPFLVLLGLGIAVRIALSAMYFPAVMESFDSARFARAGPTGAFDDYWIPAAYPAFLAVLRLVTDQLWVTIAVQHLIGLGVGALLFLTARRLGASPALACIPAAVVFLSGDHLYLEHIIMADYLLIATTAAALAVAVRGLVPKPDHRWLVAAGALAGLAMLSRSVGVVVIAVVALCAATWAGDAWRPRSTGLLSVLGGAAVILGLYVGSYHIADGRYLGLTDMRGWNLYGRVAPFADCSEFTPPSGTRALCDERPPDQRPGPFGYIWDENSISRRAFPVGPETGEKLANFAREAIWAQPVDYGRAVLIDLARYVEPTVGPLRGYSGQSSDHVSFGFRDAAVERIVVEGLSRKYSGTDVHVSRIGALESYQKLFRVDRLLLGFFLVATFGGFWVARGTLRLGVVMFGLTGLGLYVLPVVTISYDFRYGIPPATFVAVSGALGVAAALQRRGGPAVSDAR
jgi:hypothetical protein